MIHTAVLSSSCRCRATPTGMFGLQMPTPAPPATLPNRSEGEAAELPCVRYTRGASAEHANLMAVAADVVRGGVNPHKSSRSRKARWEERRRDRTRPIAASSVPSAA